MASLTPDSLNLKFKKLSNAIDSKEFKSKFKDAQNKFKANFETELGKATGEIKGGIKSLTQEVDNALEEYETVVKPTIGKITSDIPGIKEQFEKDRVNFETEMKDIISTSSDELGDFFEEFNDVTQEFSDIVEGIDTEQFREIITVANPEGLAKSMENVLNLNSREVKAALEDIKIDIDVDIAEAVDAFKDELPKISQELDGVIKSADKKLKTALGNLPTQDIMKSLIEQSTGQLEGLARSLEGVNLGTSLDIRNKLLSNDITSALDDAVKSIPVSDALKTLASESNVDLGGKDLQSTIASVTRLENKLAGSTNEALTSFKSSLSNAQSSITNVKTNVSSMVTQTDESLPSNKSPGVTPQSASKFAFINSSDELVKYLLSAKREITTVIWHWTATYNDQHHIGCFDIDLMHRFLGFDEIGYHFLIKRDGTIQRGRDINKNGAHANPGNSFSIGVAFVAGFNCSEGTPNPNRYISGASITSAQHKSFRAFMQAFYTAYPGGCAYGHVDMPNNKGKIDPGFDVAARVKQLFGKTNVGDPHKDNGCRSTSDIIKLRHNENLGNNPSTVITITLPPSMRNN